eukprot:CAMPEP_0185776942 /NCGR_PEP_ID=MMETSP1174-20130828/87710_1 /TAXON_ID=35687 /ORGANISM="Dictyocha speculum, Strain CCMP1381" /LENGTH=45 /DNA_ID= /DNA_START= /DNA_END= /DNA_ORIENTATION=
MCLSVLSSVEKISPPLAPWNGTLLCEASLEEAIRRIALLERENGA